MYGTGIIDNLGIIYNHNTFNKKIHYEKSRKHGEYNRYVKTLSLDDKILLLKLSIMKGVKNKYLIIISDEIMKHLISDFVKR